MTSAGTSSRFPNAIDKLASHVIQSLPIRTATSLPRAQYQERARSRFNDLHETPDEQPINKRRSSCQDPDQHSAAPAVAALLYGSLRRPLRILLASRSDWAGINRSGIGRFVPALLHVRFLRHGGDE